MSFIVTGAAAQVARHLADCHAPLTVSSSTWARLGPMTRSMYQWAPPRALDLPPPGGAVEAHSLVPPPSLGYFPPADAEKPAAPAAMDGGGGAAAGAPGPGAGGCEGVCQRLWTIGRGFALERQEAEFLEWHNASLAAFDQVRPGLGRRPLPPPAAPAVPSRAAAVASPFASAPLPNRAGPARSLPLTPPPLAPPPSSQLMMAMSIVCGALVLMRRPWACDPHGAGACNMELVLIEAIALVGPSMLLLLLRLAGAEIWLGQREQIW
jgi:hypothetical protein